MPPRPAGLLPQYTPTACRTIPPRHQRGGPSAETNSPRTRLSKCRASPAHLARYACWPRSTTRTRAIGLAAPAPTPPCSPSHQQADGPSPSGENAPATSSAAAHPEHNSTAATSSTPSADTSAGDHSTRPQPTARSAPNADRSEVTDPPQTTRPPARSTVLDPPVRRNGPQQRSACAPLWTDDHEQVAMARISKKTYVDSYSTERVLPALFTGSSSDGVHTDHRRGSWGFVSLDAGC